MRIPSPRRRYSSFVSRTPNPDGCALDFRSPGVPVRGRTRVCGKKGTLEVPVGTPSRLPHLFMDMSVRPDDCEANSLSMGESFVRIRGDDEIASDARREETKNTPAIMEGNF